MVQRKLAPDGVFVTQSGPAGVLSCGEVFTAINRTIASVFPRVVPYTQHIPSYVDTWVRPGRARLFRGRPAASPAAPGRPAARCRGHWGAARGGRLAGCPCGRLCRLRGRRETLQGWNMGLRNAALAFPESAEALDRLIEERIEGELRVRPARPAATCAPGASVLRAAF